MNTHIPPECGGMGLGTLDGCIGVDVARRAAPAFEREGSRYEEVADAGHFPHLERPEVVNDLVVGFLTA